MKRRVLLVVVALLATACSPTSGETTATGDETRDTVATSTTAYSGESFAGTVDAPAFPTGLDWINTDTSLTLDDLKGKVVLLDFWTYGCVNCIHVIPDLQRLEEEYPDELVVIGVHSAKFTNEGNTENIKNVVQRYGLEHAVINDKDFAVWNSWGARAWPTTALIDPAGKAVGIRAGEGVYDAVEPVIAGLVAEFDASGQLDRTPIELALEADTAPNRPLSYPGKVLAVDGRLWVSDTGHNRILEVDPVTGDVLAAYGSGAQGVTDGAATEASFNAPQGLALNDTVLYVADTNNHLIRAVDLETGRVTTVAGTGMQGWPPATGLADSVALSTPWDVLFSNGILYIANAGTHQIWALDTATGVLGPLVGSAREGTVNGAFEEAELAQPSGLALDDDHRLFFADSESSSIRAGDLAAGTASLIVGGDANLFEFGDVDGAGNQARLQHPLGIAVSGNTLYVADTYNSKIKRVDTAQNSISSWLGDASGWEDGTTPLFNEPGGLSLDGDVLYVADTNNHAVRLIDVNTSEATTLVLKGIEAFDPPAEYAGSVVHVPSQTVNAGQASLVLEYELPDGYKVNEDAPSSVVVAGGDSIAALASDTAGDITGTKIPATVPIVLTEGSGTALFDVTLIYCRVDATSLCLIDQVRYEAPLTVGPEGASSQLVLNRSTPLPGG
ncbi:MAG: thioredoxin-like domain-containing protein [Actinomycetota bacterium]